MAKCSSSFFHSKVLKLNKEGGKGGSAVVSWRNFTQWLCLITAAHFVNNSINCLFDWLDTSARLPDETAKTRAKLANPLYA